MKIIIEIYIACLLSIASTAENNRRGDISYSTNIIHNNPKYPDQQAQSSIDVQFQNPEGTKFNEQNNGFIPYSYEKPKSPDYSQTELTQTPIIVKESPYQSPNSNFYRSGSRSNKNYPDQEFNVGYSVNFSGSKNPQDMNVENTEIITGTKQSTNFENNEFLYNVFLDDKKQKLSDIKSKYYPVTTTNHKQLLTQANVAHTQEKLAQLENVHGNQQVPQFGGNTPWNVRRPSDMYHSDKDEIFAEESRTFDHAKALGKSEGFDYSDAINLKYVSSSATSENSIKPKSNSIPINLSTKNVQPIQLKTDIYHFPKQIQLNLDSKRYLPTVQNSPVGITRKYPMDTSLLREPVVTYQPNPTNTNPNILPIRFDTKLLQQAINGNVDLNEQSSRFTLVNGNLKPVTQNINGYVPQDVGGKQIYNIQQFVQNPTGLSTHDAQNQNSYQPISDLFKFPQDEIKLNQPSPQFEVHQKYGFQQHINQDYSHKQNGPNAPTISNQLYKNYKLHGKRYSDLYTQNEYLIRKPRITPNFVKNIQIDLKPPPPHFINLRRMYTTNM